MNWYLPVKFSHVSIKRTQHKEIVKCYFARVCLKI